MVKYNVSRLALSLLILSLINISSAQSSIRIVYGLTLSVSGIDPHINQSSELGIVLRQVYDTLVYRHPITGEFVPGLATSWEVDAEGLEYTFELRQDVVFHDGTPFDASAVAANLDRILDPAIASQRARFLLGPFAGYELLGSHRIKLILREPFSALLDGLAQVYLGIASPTQLRAYADDPVLYQFHQIGTGPFIFVEYLPEDRIVLKRNRDYKWGPAFYESPGNVDEIEFRWFTDPTTRLLALERGDAHIVGEILPADARRSFGSNRITIVPVGIPGQPLQFYFNTAQPPTDRVEFRQALIMATNRTAIVEAVFQGFSPVAWGPLSSRTQFYTSSVVGAYNYDSAQAIALLESAGYVDSDGDGIREMDGQPITLTLIQPPWGLIPQVVQFMVSQWRDIGIQTNVVAVPGFTSLLEQVRSGNYHLVSFETSGLDPTLLNSRFRSDGVNNWTNYANPELDALLDFGAVTTDPTQRAAAYERVQVGIMQQALILPIREVVNLNGHVRGISGLMFDRYGWFPLLYGVSYDPNA
jgi:peptide/nickel transport system substrate-binding protein